MDLVVERSDVLPPMLLAAPNARSGYSGRASRPRHQFLDKVEICGFESRRDPIMKRNPIPEEKFLTALLDLLVAGAWNPDFSTLKQVVEMSEVMVRSRMREISRKKLNK